MSDDVCPRGETHELTSDDDGSFCVKCYHPMSSEDRTVAKKASKVASKKIKSAKATKPAKSAKAKVDKPVKATKKVAAKKAPKTKEAAPIAEGKGKPLSLVGAAAQVLGDFPDGLNARELFAEIEKRGLWTTAKGKTPHQTLAAALSRLIAKDGKASGFARKDRGVFVLGAS